MTASSSPAVSDSRSAGFVLEADPISELQRQSGQKHTYLSMLFRKDKENTRRRTWLAMLLQFMGQGFIGYGLSE